MASVIPVGTAVNDAERRAIAHLRDHLPDSCLLLHNFEIQRDRDFFEVDLALLTPHAVYLVDVKGTRGDIHVYGPKWYPDGRTPFASPLLKLRAHARALKGLITSTGRDRRELDRVYVGAAILLTAPDARLEDEDGRDKPHVTTLRNAQKFFSDKSRRPSHFDDNIRPYFSRILSAIQGRARPRHEPLRFGHWEALERLGSTHFYTEYRAAHQTLGADAGTVLLRVYQADPYLPEEKKKHQMARITNAYRALANVPTHPGIVDERDFFATEGEDRYVLVTEDPRGRALAMHLRRPELALPPEHKVRVARDVLDALRHVHNHDVVHRNLHPGNIFLDPEGRTLLTHFDYARAGHDRALTIARDIVDDLEKHHQAPECFGEPEAATPASDVFSAGLVLYELFAGRRPFENAEELFDREAVFPEPASARAPGLPGGFDSWLQSLCAFDPAARPSAERALADFEGLFGTAGP